MKQLLVVAALAVASVGMGYGQKMPNLFIAPMEGNLDGFIAAEMIKQSIPVRIVADEKDAQYILVGLSVRADDKWYNVVFGGKDKNEGNVRLMNVATKTMIWAGEAGDRSLFYSGWRRGGLRKVAERIVGQIGRENWLWEELSKDNK